MTTDTQTLVDAVEAGEMTDPGAMTTTQDVADVVAYSYETVDEKLSALERDGAIESTNFGGDRVWVVPADDDAHRNETTESQIISTTTRDTLSI